MLQARNAIDQLADTMLMGRPITIREERGDATGGGLLASGVGGSVGARVYVGNLSWDVSWQDLKDHMRQASLSSLECFSCAVPMNMHSMRIVHPVRHHRLAKVARRNAVLPRQTCLRAAWAPDSQAGDVKFVDLFQVPGGRSKGCAVVEYKNPQHAHIAIRDLNDTELKGRMMFVREDREEVRRKAWPLS